MQPPLGLSSAEAATRLMTLRQQAPTTTSKSPNLLGEILREPMLLMLLAAGGLYTIVGEAADAIMLLVAVLVVITITYIQRRRTERSLAALRAYAQRQTRVLRDGLETMVDSATLVPGDVMIVGEGDRLQADATLCTAEVLTVDESLLTGEALAITKHAAGDATLHAGTLVTHGQGQALVTKVGAATTLGEIDQALGTLHAAPTLVEAETHMLIRRFAWLGLGLCVVLATSSGWLGGNTWASWRNGLLAGLSLAMGILPEEFPVVLTVFFALGAWRLARVGVLARRMSALETLGAATILCVDKTGTLTENRMRVAATSTQGTTADPATDANAEADAQLRELAANACRPAPFDPMELAMLAAVPTVNTIFPARIYDVSPDFLAMVVARSGPEGYTLAAKGAPETILAHCRHVDAAAHTAILAQVQEYAQQGRRVLALADGVCTRLPDTPANVDLRYRGLIALEDPLRPSAPPTIATCRAAGVRVIMITGDHPETARHIAQQAGLAAGPVLTGSALAALDPTSLATQLATTSVFARVTPSQKLALVTALKAQGEIVAMTGDGVNDAPALKAAHIGIAMGNRGTDVAREAAALVLLNDDFAAIAAAIRLGRRVYDNLQKSFAFLIAVHIPIVGMALVPMFTPGTALLLLPIHIAFFEIVIDPACSLVFEAEAAEEDVMRRPPRSSAARLLTWRAVGTAIALGGSVLSACLLTYVFFRAKLGPDALRALLFTTLMSGITAILLGSRAWSRSLWASLRTPNAPLRWGVALVAAALAMVLFIPALQGLFHFDQVRPSAAAAAALLGLLSVGWLELVKLFRKAPTPANHA